MFHSKFSEFNIFFGGKSNRTEPSREMLTPKLLPLTHMEENPKNKAKIKMKVARGCCRSLWDIVAVTD